jgi:hypothetical protein
MTLLRSGRGTDGKSRPTAIGTFHAGDTPKRETCVACSTRDAG